MWSFFSRDSSKDFPYEIGECVSGLDAKSIWSMHKAKRKVTNEEVTVFVYDIKNGSDTKLEIAKSSMKRLKTLRHPSILQYLDSAETDKMLYVATEYVQPLGIYFDQLEKDSTQTDWYLSWGIFQITVSMCECCGHARRVHENLKTRTVCAVICQCFFLLLLLIVFIWSVMVFTLRFILYHHHHDSLNK